jgi:transposase
MHLVKEVLRLTAAGLSQRQIARSLHLSHGVVGKYQAAAQRAGLSWPLPEALDEVTLANRLCTKESTRAPTAHVAPDFANIHEQLKEKGVTRLLLWEEYRAADPGKRVFAGSDVSS